MLLDIGAISSVYLSVREVRTGGALPFITENQLAQIRAIMDELPEGWVTNSYFEPIQPSSDVYYCVRVLDEKDRPKIIYCIDEIRQRMPNDPKTKRYGPGEKISLQKFSENSSRSSQAKR
jgi:hypothetical protein